MIGRLRGKLVSRTETGVMLDVGGVGYEIFTTPRDLTLLPGVGQEVVLHTNLTIREDRIDIYGFTDQPFRDLFRVLIKCNGVGSALAMGILGALTPEEIRRAVATDDVQALTVAPGVGKRKAEKLILELRPKMGSLETSFPGGGGLAPVREALESLGYAQSEIRQALENVDQNEPVEKQIRQALQVLGNR